MVRTINNRQEPSGNRPGTVTLEDGSQHKFWAKAPFAALMQVGSSAECETEMVAGKGNYPAESFIKSWGAPQGQAAPRAASGGSRISPEERTAIEAQACIKAACELHANNQSSDADVVASADSFFQFIQDCKGA